MDNEPNGIPRDIIVFCILGLNGNDQSQQINNDTIKYCGIQRLRCNFQEYCDFVKVCSIEGKITELHPDILQGKITSLLFRY